MHADNRTYAIYRQLMLEAYRNPKGKEVMLADAKAARAVRAKLYSYFRWAKVNDPDPELLEAMIALSLRIDGGKLTIRKRGDDENNETLLAALETKPTLPEKVEICPVTTKLDVEIAESERRMVAKLAMAASYGQEGSNPPPTDETEPELNADGTPKKKSVNPYASVLRHSKG